MVLAKKGNKDNFKIDSCQDHILMSPIQKESQKENNYW